MSEPDTADLDVSVTNGDEFAEELEEAVGLGDDDGVDEVGESGLEAVEGYELPGVVLDGGLEEATPSLDGLRDAYEASFDPVPQWQPMPLTATVIGTDERRRISPANKYPWRVHCALRITARDNSRWIGTAFFISPRVLATAGHNLFMNSPIAGRRGWVNKIEVMPGRDGNTLPYGSTASTRFYSVNGWTRDADDEYDYGAIVLDTPVGNSTGWLGFGAYSDRTLTSSTGNLSGYPQDRGNGAQQWYMARRIRSAGPRKIFYDIDTFGGQSGSAVYRISGGSRHAMGIHTYGVGGGSSFNSATRITSAAFNNLKAWKAANP